MYVQESPLSGPVPADYDLNEVSNLVLRYGTHNLVKKMFGHLDVGAIIRTQLEAVKGNIMISGNLLLLVLFQSILIVSSLCRCGVCCTSARGGPASDGSKASTCGIGLRAIFATAAGVTPQKGRGQYGLPV